MSIKSILRSAGRVLGDNSPGILTGIGAAGTVTTAVLAARAGYTSYEKLLEKSVDENDNYMKLPLEEQVKIVWKEYVPTVISGVVSVAAIVMANRVGSGRAAALTAAMKVSEQLSEDYRRKVLDEIGPKAEEKIRNKVAVDRMSANPPAPAFLMIADNEVLFYDDFSGRYFKSDWESVRRSVNNVNEKILNEMYASLSDLYNELGLQTTSTSDQIGWSSEQLLEVEMMPILVDNKPAVSILYNRTPIDRFNRLH